MSAANTFAIHLLTALFVAFSGDCVAQIGLPIPGAPTLPGLPSLPGIPGSSGVPGLGLPGLPPVPGVFPPGVLPPGVPPIDLPKCISELAGSGILGPPIGPPLIGPPIPGFPSSFPSSGFPLGCIDTKGNKVAPQPPLVQRAPTRSVAAASTIAPGAVYADIVFYSLYECRVDWQHYCDGNDIMFLPNAKNLPDEAWQACKPLFAIAENTGATAGPGFAASKWFAIDPVLPASFRAYTLRIHANGNNLPPIFRESRGAVISLRNVGIRLIPSNSSLRDRLKAECEFPPNP